MAPQGCALVRFVIHTGQVSRSCPCVVPSPQEVAKKLFTLLLSMKQFCREGDEEVDEEVNKATATRMRAHFHANVTWLGN